MSNVVAALFAGMGRYKTNMALAFASSALELDAGLGNNVPAAPFVLGASVGTKLEPILSQVRLHTFIGNSHVISQGAVGSAQAEWCEPVQGLQSLYRVY